MKKLDEDVEILKDYGFFEIAKQYKRMAKALMKIEKYAQSRDFIVYLNHVEDTAGAALKRFKGGVK